MQNNWRPSVNITHLHPTIKIRAIDYIWETQRDLVEDELKLLLRVGELDHRDPKVFQQRYAAAKLALSKMTEEERAEVEVGLERWRAEGHPEKVQR